ncbi:phospholipase D-like domain-containing protein [Fluviicola sp.]|uniref:phospholipase D-like domain-containing protein n=1 Tax=Fluviicola sp. TaxID=1917219 RepID=UPI0031DA8D60
MSKTINNVTGDIYIGEGSGKMILDDMLKAKRSIRVMSPYLSAKLVDILLERFRFGVHIELVTSNEVEDHAHADKNSYRIIQQHKHVDKELKSRKEFLYVSGIVLMLVFGFLAVANLSDLFAESVNVSDVVAFTLFTGIAFIGQWMRNYAKGIRFWHYSYSSLFPIKIFGSYFTRKKPGRSRDFNLHSKLYIIDDCIAYLGSVNFTRSGCLFNHETRIRITDPEAIRQLKQEFSELLWNEEYSHTSVEEWGREVYERTE